METEEKQNPNSHELIIRDTRNAWSELPADLLVTVFERLGYANFQRAKSICSSWHSASRQCVPKKKIHWLILNSKDSCMLFNPEEKDKLYQTQDLDLSKGDWIATYGGSWFLMSDDLCTNLYIVNIFTHEIINLPPVESQLGMRKMKRDEYNGFTILSPVFWVDEKTKDYIVLWRLEYSCVVYSKKGDMFWNPIPKTSDCYDVVYKNHKLYLLGRYGVVRIFSLAGETPQESFLCRVPTPNNEPFDQRLEVRHWRNPWTRYRTKLVVTVTGQVLKVVQLYKYLSRVWSFRVYKVCSSGFSKKKKQIKSLGDETMLFEQGITVLANDVEGFISNAIYFSYGDEDTTGILVFDLNTRKVEPLHKYDWSSGQFFGGQWFLPSFTHSS
ncbi:unnamed protein product [Microthlaspi erraticum]|uniref:F-box domain-containing protein n=1 Tax=Microthlaspi erraticum TaxID=1685480 RepID=A0A6D2KXL6_9BRAS|nr:unnamed protein product [Microthlaspi erraticum]